MEDLSENYSNRQLINILVDKRYRLLRHAILLIGFLGLLFYTVNLSSEYSGIYRYYSLLSIYITFILMFYINMYVLIPAFFFRAKYMLYLLALMVMIILGLYNLTFISNSLLAPFRVQDHHKISDNIGNLVWFIIVYAVILVTTTIKLFQKWTSDRDRIVELKDLTLHMELNELKNQINPHFLFNMLNNVNVLIKNNPDKASMIIHKLSEFLRYQLYENSGEKTLLSAEVRFLSNFLNLEKIRRDNFQFTIETDPARFSSIFLPPNLFTTFVENALKHSVDLSGAETYVNVHIRIDKGRLFFRCCNSRSEDYNASVTANGGLGLANIKRRLELLYKEQYSLEISSSEKEYTVNLIIPI